MVEALKSTQNNDDTIKKIVLSKEGIKTFIKKELHEFVSPETVNFFSRFKISADFIDFHPDNWKEREDYKKGINILTELSVINDVAERGVKLIQEYNSILTKDENQKQFLLQVQISELITNIESADVESDWFSNGDTSDSELESESFTKIIREKLVSKLCSTPVNTVDSNTLSSQWNFDENVCSEYIPTQIKFNDASSVNVDVLDDLSPEFCEMDIFKIIFDEHLVQHIVDETNKCFHYAIKNLVTKQHSKLNKWQETNINEMYTFFALTFLMAHQKKNNMKDYWSTSLLLYSPIFGKIMTQDRYLILLRMLHFCDNLNQIPGNRLFKIETIVESLRMKFRSVFKPYQKICVDESIVEWKGRLKFKQYIPSKRHHFGNKLFVLCDCKTGFVLDFLVYTGNDQHIHFNESLQQSCSVISTLM
ncbi:hypothetical protein QTP88_017371 [Uroleucon formosanum]